jgi:hypothetical protein
MHPRSGAAEIAPSPFNPNVLRYSLVAQFNMNHELRRNHFFNTRPSETRIWEISPTALECAHPVQFAHIQTVGGQLFDGQSGMLAVARHGIRLKVLSISATKAALKA